jgi:hypothetical protein
MTFIREKKPEAEKRKPEASYRSLRLVFAALADA